MKDRKGAQTRTIPSKFRAEQAGSRKIEGYFAVFGGVYELWPGATESIDRHAFDDAIGGDIRALIDHETRLVIGRSKAGTFTLKIDNKGLWGSVNINENDTDATNLYARVERGDVSQGSFGFDILEENTDIKPDGSVHWTIKKVKLYECSLVTFPAYEDTGLSARKTQFDDLQKRKKENGKPQDSKESIEAWRSRMMKKLKRAMV